MSITAVLLYIEEYLITFIYYEDKCTLVPTFPLQVLINPNSFPAHTKDTSSSIPVFRVCEETPSSSKEDTPKTSTHFLASFNGSSVIVEAGATF